ncbi:MAG: translation factor GTPase family protein [Clostridia bacterium]|nr:translation factor GTPase family protein [Clostridia bacterium]
MKKITIGILAHVDSGKTTLSEAILYKTGIIRTPGRVDSGNTFMDTDGIEKERGITVFSNSAKVALQNTELTLVDTPGHVDFSPEAERTLSVIDYAVLVISGTSGVQSHTETLWKLLKGRHIPAFIFINKMDISEKTADEIMTEIKTKLSEKCVNFENGDFLEELALCDERLLEAFEEEKLDDAVISDAIKKRRIFPCFFGSALKYEGVDGLLMGLDKYSAEPHFEEEFGAKVYKITRSEHGERLTHMKITGGRLSVKDIVSGVNKDLEPWSEKVNQIRIYSGAKFKAVPFAESGTLCAAVGLTETYPGMGLGFEKPEETAVLKPVLNYRAVLPEGVNPVAALSKFRILEQEEPQLSILWDSRKGEICFKIMGEIQLEVLKRIIAERFDMEVDFSYSSIAYLETIDGTAYGAGHYEPLKHYAEVRLRLEALPRGSGLVFASECSENTLAKNWQRLIMTHLKEKQHIGVLTGSPITDMKITLTNGRAHQKHTEGGDFRQATYRAVRQGLMQAQSVLLEPWYDFRLEIPNECVGRAMTDITNMGGSFFQPEPSGDFSVISGSAPVFSMRNYQTEVIAYTKGFGKLSLMTGGYRECQNAAEVIESIGYDPEADLENTPDSVFCSHGAGFTVNWREVESFCHTDGEKEEQAEFEEKVHRYVARAASDAELMKIFEMTYGSMNKPLHTALKSVKKPEKPYRSPTKKLSGKEYLLIDGYNIIFAWDDLKKLSEKSLDLARNTLINRLCNYKGLTDFEIILVFDAYKVRHNHGEIERVHNIDVVYTKEAETADMYIEKVTHELSRNHKVRVATSDGLEQIIIIGNGAVRVTAADFKKEIETAENKIREYLENQNMKNDLL